MQAAIRLPIANELPSGDARSSVMSGPLRGPDSQSSSSIPELRGANKEQSIRQVTTRLKGVAERNNIAIILVRHLNKSGGRQSLYRGGGSIGIIAATRSALLVAKSPDDPHMRVLCHVKSNLGPLAPSLLFEPVTLQENVVGIRWRGPCDFNGEELLGGIGKGGGKLEEAKGFLLELLREGPVEQKEIAGQCAAKAIAYRTVERAKDALEIVSTRKGFSGNGVFFWELPSGEVQEDEPDNPHIDRQPDLAVYDGREGDLT